MECSRTRIATKRIKFGSNNTNKWNAQEPYSSYRLSQIDQIIPINGMLKNFGGKCAYSVPDQIIPINGMLKNCKGCKLLRWGDQIIPINGMLKNS